MLLCYLEVYNYCIGLPGIGAAGVSAGEPPERGMGGGAQCALAKVCPWRQLLVMVQATQLPALLLKCKQATGQGEQTTISGVAYWGHVGPRVPTGWLGRVHPLLHAQQGAWGNNAKGY